MQMKGTMMKINRQRKLKLNKLQALKIIANVCQKHGCEIRRVDLDRHILDIQGSDDAQKKCKQELEMLLD
jgi:hypothetical protein